MSSTLSVVGNMVFPNAPGGSNTSVPIGSPDVTPSDTTGAQLTYNEKACFEYTIAPAGVLPVNFGTVSDGDFIYVGTDQDITYKMNGGSDVFTLAENGFIMQMHASLTALEITNAAVLDANIVVMIFGD